MEWENSFQIAEAKAALLGLTSAGSQIFNDLASSSHMNTMPSPVIAMESSSERNFCSATDFDAFLHLK